MPDLYEREGFLLNVPVFFRYSQLALRAPQFHVISGNFGDYRHHYIAIVLDARLGTGRSGLHLPAPSAEYVYFPACVKTRLEKILLEVYPTYQILG